jgi:branched-chain amino acid transport system ATP-binding protein
MLSLDGVWKTFGGVEALRGVSLEVRAGSINGLIGPNGAGKTTLFNVVTGAAPATRGTVRFDGRDVTRLAPHDIAKLGIARTYQLVRPFFELTVAENVEIGIVYGRAQAPPRRQIAADVAHHLELVGLQDKRDHTAAELNLSERKQLEIAKALAARPRLVAFDEVLAGLNPTETMRAVEVFRRINEMGTTILMIEHNMQAIMSACRQIFVLHHGELIAEGSPLEVSRHAAVVEAYLGRKDFQLRRRPKAPSHA